MYRSQGSNECHSKHGIGSVKRTGGRRLMKLRKLERNLGGTLGGVVAGSDPQ